MTTTWPGTIDSFVTNVDGVDYVLAADVNNLQDAMVAVQTQEGINPRRRFMTAGDFGISFGAPAAGLLGWSGGARQVLTWRFDDAASEIIGAAIEYPAGPSGSTIYADVWWAMESAVAGNVYFDIYLNALATGENTDAAMVGHVQTIAVPGTAKYLKKTTFTISLAYVAGDLILATFTRTGGNAADTAAGDLHFIAATIRFA